MIKKGPMGRKEKSPKLLGAAGNVKAYSSLSKTGVAGVGGKEREEIEKGKGDRLDEVVRCRNILRKRNQCRVIKKILR